MAMTAPMTRSWYAQYRDEPRSFRAPPMPVAVCHVCHEVEVPNLDAGEFDSEGPTCNDCLALLAEEERPACSCNFATFHTGYQTFSREWYVAHKAHHLAVFPGVDERTRANLDLLIERAS